MKFNRIWKVLFISFLCVGLFDLCSDKPASTSAAASACSTKPAESKKTFTFASFSSLKPKPKIFVGAAFFSTVKKPTSMYKKTTVKSSNKMKPAQMKPPVPVKKQQNPAEVCALQGYTPLKTKQQQKPHQELIIYFNILSILAYPFVLQATGITGSYRAFSRGCFQSAVHPVETKAEQMSVKPTSKFDPLDWTDSTDEQSETLQLPMYNLSIHKCKLG